MEKEKNALRSFTIAVLIAAAAGLCLYLAFGPGAGGNDQAQGPATPADLKPNRRASEEKSDGKGPQEAERTASEGKKAEGETAGSEAPAPVGVITGKIVDDATGEFVPGAAVRASPFRAQERHKGTFDLIRRFETGKATLTAASGEKGEYTIEVTKAGKWRVWCTAGKTQYMDMLPEEGVIVDIKEGEKKEGVDFRLLAGASVVGTVSDKQGRPIAGAQVQVRVQWSPFITGTGAQIDTKRTETDSEGRFRLGGFREKVAYGVTAQAEGFASKTVTVSIPKGADEVTLDIRLAAGFKVQGTVLDAEGKPVERAVVYFIPAGKETDSESRRTLFSESDGTFVCEDLPAGRYHLAASRRFGDLIGVSPENHPELWRKIDIDSDLSGIEVQVYEGTASGEEGSVRLWGTVRGSDGNGVEGAELRLAKLGGGTNPSAQSDPKGDFEFSHLEKGEYILFVKADGFASKIVTGIKPEDSPHEIVLDPLGTISGRVLNANDRKPVPGARVWAKRTEEEEDPMLSAMRMAQSMGKKPREAVSGPDGSFTLEGVEPGKLELTATREGFAPGRITDVILEPGGEITGVTILLGGGLTVSGTVLAPDGAVVPGAKVWLVPLRQNAMAKVMSVAVPGFTPQGAVSAYTEENGVFTLKDLTADTYEIYASHGDFCPSDPLTIELETDVTDLALRLREGGTLTIKVVRNGKGVPGAVCQVMGSRTPKMALTDAKGTASFEHLVPHDYLVQLMTNPGGMAGDPLRGMRQFVVTIEEGKNTEKEIRLGEGVVLEGTVKGLSPETGPLIACVRKPDAPGFVMGMPADFQSAIDSARYNVGFAYLKEDGKFTIEDLPEGRFRLEVYAIKDVMRKPDAENAGTGKTEMKPIWSKEIRISKTAPPKIAIELK